MELFQKAVFLLSRRDYSKKELFARLMRDEHSDEEEVACIIEKLESLDYINELRFARSRARQKMERFGNRKIALDLKEKGVQEELIALVLKESKTEEKRCFEIWEKRFSAPKNEKEKAKQGRFLLNRGFPPQMVFALLKKVEKIEKN